MKVAKTYKIEEATVDMIKQIADRDYGGNLTAAVEGMIHQSYCLRSIEENCRWAMYSAAKAHNGGFDDKSTRNYIDGLYI